MNKIKIFLTFSILTFFSQILTAQSQRPLVSGINTSSSTKKIIITWKLPKKTEGSHITSLLLYRRNRPFTSAKDIEGLKPLAKLSSNAESYSDSLEDYAEYFYAVISVTAEGSWTTSELYYDEQLDEKPSEKNGKALNIILPGVNATTQGAKLKRYSKKEAKPTVKEENKKTEYKEGELRRQPLPYIDVLDNQTEKESKISKEAEKTALSLIGKNSSSSKKTLEMYIFEEDLISPSGGDDYLLFEVLRKSFIKEDFTLSEKELKKFLAQNRSKSSSSRANFYLGQSYYFTGRYASALSCFLKVEEDFPILANKWIESTLNLFEQ